MKYVERYHKIRQDHLCKGEFTRAYALEGEILNLLFENAQLASQIDFLKGGSDVA
jgi:hypothetical protein